MASAPSLHEYYRAAKERLRAARFETADLDARLLIQAVLKLSPEDFFLKADTLLADDDIKQLDHFIDRRLKHEPVSRILGRRAFWKSEFIVTPDTLDPRADSETLIEAVLEYVPPSETVLDLGTGTGCLLLSLLQEWPIAIGTGVDISPGAVNTARENAAALLLQDRTSFFTSGWEDFFPDHKFDVIISNPPYITSGEMQELEPDVRLYDPIKALEGGDSGLEAYQSLIRCLPRWVHPDTWIFFEIGSKQALSVRKELEKAGFKVIDLRRDLGGNDRVLVARVA